SDLVSDPSSGRSVRTGDRVTATKAKRMRKLAEEGSLTQCLYATAGAAGENQRLFQDGLEQFPHFGRILRRPNPALLHDGELLIGSALAAGDDRAGVAHALARRRRHTGDEADDGLLHVGLDPARRFFLVAAADLAHHDHRLGLRIVVEHLEDIDVLQAVDGVSAHADAARLSETDRGQLAHRLVGEGAGTRHHADRSALVYVAGHDADLDLVRRDDPATVGADQQRLAGLHPIAGLHHVQDRDALGDADHEIEAGIDRLVDGRRREGRRHVNHRDVGAGRLLRLFHRLEYRYAFVALSALLRRDAGDVAGFAVRVLLAHLGVELPGLAGDALGQHPR